MQVGRALQPSVFMIDECEKMFKKKLPKTDLVCNSTRTIIIYSLFINIKLILIVDPGDVL